MKHRFIHYALLLFGIILALSFVACKIKPEPVLHAAPALQWAKTFDGDVGRSIQQTKDGGYIICGWTESYSGGIDGYYDCDALLTKTDASGNQMWNKIFGSEEKSYTRAYSVQQTADGGYIIGGSTDVFGGTWLIKTDAKGDKLWERTLDGFGESYNIPVQQTADSGYIICHGRLLIKTDREGNELWKKTYDRTDDGYNAGFSLQQLPFGRYIICGCTSFTKPIHKSEVWLAKIGTNGDKLWEKTFGGPDDRWWAASGNSAFRTSDGGYIIGGWTEFRSGETILHYIWLIKTDAAGNKIWDRTFSESAAWLNSIEQTRDGGYIICGGKDSDVWLMKTNDNGDKLWEKTFGEVGYEQGYSCKQTADGGYIICGERRGIGGGVDGGVLVLKLACEQ